MDIYRKYFGQRLEKALEKSGLSQKDLAEILGINPSNISRWVKGKDFPDDSRLPDICKALEVDEAFFLPAKPSNEEALEQIRQLVVGFEKRSHELRKETDTLLAALERATPQQKEMVKAFLDGDETANRGQKAK